MTASWPKVSNFKVLQYELKCKMASRNIKYKNLHLSSIGITP